MTLIDLTAILPALILAGYACLLLLADLAIPENRKRWTAALALLGLAASGAAMIPWPAGGQLVAFGGMLYADGFAVFLNITFLVTGALTVLLAVAYLPRMGLERGEFYVLMLFSVTGMMLMAQAGDLIVVFLALELLSIPLYILSGIARPRLSSEEAAMKYFLLGSFASGFLLYGIALGYGATGSTHLATIVSVIGAGQADTGLLVLGVGLIMVGLGFKVAVVPFHMWTPDVYDGAPSVVTAFMSVGAKAGGFAALMRVFALAFPDLAGQWVIVAAILAALTMTLGNFAAIAQSSIKRMLAYSSIAHAGYVLMGVVAAGAGAADPALRDLAIAASLFYLLAYAVTNLGAWSVVMAVERSEGAGLLLSDYAGLGVRRPALALAMALFMLSLTGVPLTVGFIGKFYVFRAVLDAGYVWLAIVGVLTSLVSAYYYLRVVIIMFMQAGEPVVVSRRSLNLAIGLTALATFIFGIVPGPLMDAATRSVIAFTP
jgi:NADH-quinone oxidoreductase subunit N